MKIDLYSNGTAYSIEVGDGSYHLVQLSGDDVLSVKFELNHFVELSADSYVNYQGRRHTLSQRPDVTMLSQTCYEYVAEFSAVQSVLTRTMLRYDDHLTVHYNGTLREHLTLIVNAVGASMNIVLPDQFNDEPRTITYESVNGWEAIMQATKAWNVDFNASAQSITIVTRSRDQAVSLRYGEHLLPNVARRSASIPIKRLYLKTSDRNIPTAYGYPNLRVPRAMITKFDGVDFTPSTGFDDSQVIEIATSDQGDYIEIKGGTEGIDKTIDAQEIYPQRVGRVSSVKVVNAEKHLYDFVDIFIPSSLNYATSIIAGQSIKVVFQTGRLAGIEFEASYKHSERRFKLVQLDYYGTTIPNETFTPKAGDRYIVVGCEVPSNYITSAEWLLLRTACLKLYDAQQSTFEMTAKPNPLSDEANGLMVGTPVTFVDAPFLDNQRSSRVTTIKTNLLTQERELTFSNAKQQDEGLTSYLKKAQGQLNSRLHDLISGARISNDTLRRIMDTDLTLHESIRDQLKQDEAFIQATKGDKGDKGDIGPQGLQGDKGDAGVAVRANLLRNSEVKLYNNDGRFASDVEYIGDGRYKFTQRTGNKVSMYGGVRTDVKRDLTAITSWRVVDSSKPIIDGDGNHYEHPKLFAGRYYYHYPANYAVNGMRQFSFGHRMVDGGVGDWIIIDQVKIEYVEEGEAMLPTSYIPHVDELKGADGQSVELSEVVGSLKGDVSFREAVKGDKGEDGKNGRDGVDGTNGRDGAKGDKGDKGIDGINGRDGVDGKDVDPATVEEIKRKNQEALEKAEEAARKADLLKNQAGKYHPFYGEWSPELDYPFDDKKTALVIYNDMVYRAIKKPTKGHFYSSQWEAISATAEFIYSRYIKAETAEIGDMKLVNNTGSNDHLQFECDGHRYMQLGGSIPTEEQALEALGNGWSEWKMTSRHGSKGVGTHRLDANSVEEEGQAFSMSVTFNYEARTVTNPNPWGGSEVRHNPVRCYVELVPSKDNRLRVQSEVFAVQEGTGSKTLSCYLNSSVLASGQSVYANFVVEAGGLSNPIVTAISSKRAKSTGHKSFVAISRNAGLLFFQRAKYAILNTGRWFAKIMGSLWVTGDLRVDNDIIIRGERGTGILCGGEVSGQERIHYSRYGVCSVDKVELIGTHTVRVYHNIGHRGYAPLVSPLYQAWTNVSVSSLQTSYFDVLISNSANGGSWIDEGGRIFSYVCVGSIKG